MKIQISPKHPRYASLMIREILIKYFDEGIVAKSGLIAHGRGEAFDYLIGEETIEPAKEAIRAAAAALILAKHPVISVNGNAAALSAKEIVALSKVVNARIEVNIFYKTLERELKIKRVLEEAGAEDILGVGDRASAIIPEIFSERRRVDPEGILKADVVLVPLEDGDRTEALVKIGKTVIAIDLNPLSRTSQRASISIVDNIVRAMPLLIEEIQALKRWKRGELGNLLDKYDNKKILDEVLCYILERLKKLAGR